MAMDTGRRGGRGRGRVCGARRRADALQVASRRAEHLGLGGHIRHVLHPAARGSIFSRRRQRPFDPVIRNRANTLKRVRPTTWRLGRPRICGSGAISIASSTIVVRMFDATRQPTVIRLNASVM